jgi:hypothetical protein
VSIAQWDDHRRELSGRLRLLPRLEPEIRSAATLITGSGGMGVQSALQRVPCQSVQAKRAVGGRRCSGQQLRGSRKLPAASRSGLGIEALRSECASPTSSGGKGHIGRAYGGMAIVFSTSVTPLTRRATSVAARFMLLTLTAPDK